MKKPAVNSKALRQGGYLAAVTAAVVALVVLINLVVGQLPSNVTEFDLTDNSLYEITDTSKDFFPRTSCPRWTRMWRSWCWRRRTPPTSVS